MKIDLLTPTEHTLVSMVLGCTTPMSSCTRNPEDFQLLLVFVIEANDEFFDERYEMAEDGNYQVTRDTRGGYEEVDLEELENYQEYPDGEDIQYSEDGEDELDDESFVGEEQMRA